MVDQYKHERFLKRVELNLEATTMILLIQWIVNNQYVEKLHQLFESLSLKQLQQLDQMKVNFFVFQLLLAEQKNWSYILHFVY